jgi:dihydropteroate synthase
MELLRARVLSLPTEADAREEASRMKVSESEVEKLASTSGIETVKLEGVPQEVAAAIQQTVGLHYGIALLAMESLNDRPEAPGAASSPHQQALPAFQPSPPSSRTSSPGATLLLSASVALLLQIASRLQRSESRAEREVGLVLHAVLVRHRGLELGATSCGGVTFEWGKRTYVMGIINVTPNSFSGDGIGTDVEAAVAQGKRFVEEGADILDVGGESTRPGAEPVTAEEELRRVIPVIKRLAEEVKVPVSIDSFKLLVVQEALEAGARMINDVWGLRRTEGLASLAAAYDVPIVLMHNRRALPTVGELGGHYQKVHYTDLMGEILAEMRESIDLALNANVRRENIIVDPGIGFGKSPEQNLVVMRRLREFRSLGRPILVGTSRKSLIGLSLGVPMDDRMEGTAATVAVSICNGADIVRVHDVKEMARVCRMTDAIVRVMSDG